MLIAYILPTTKQFRTNYTKHIKIQVPETTDLKNQNAIRAGFDQGECLEP